MPNLTDEQLDLLRTLARVYRSGCKSAFIVAFTHGGTSLVYECHDNIAIEADMSDFEQLAAEDLITLGHTSQGSLRGKITAQGLALAERASTTADQPAMPRAISRVFIGHGRSLVWRELKDFIVDRLGLEYDEFNREPAAGITTKERLEEMLARADFALLVLTAEDEQPDGTVRARENVVHEAGLFQGKLGFRRAIVLLEDGCQQFSNIHGLTHIPFPKGQILAAFEEIRRVIERENAATDSHPPSASVPLAITAAPGGASGGVGRRAHASAVGILRRLCGEALAGDNLPDVMWQVQNPQWSRIARQLGEIDKVLGRFEPHVEPSLFDGADQETVRASQRILELYLWSADNFARFDAVRREFDLPAPADVRALLVDCG